MVKSLKKLFSIFSNIHLQSLIANGLMSVFGVVTLSILYRTLSAIDLGIYIFFLSIIGLIDNLRAGFLTITIVKFFSGTTVERGKEITGSAWLLSVIIAVLFLVINIPTYFIADYVSDQGMVLILRFFSVISIATLPCFMADCIVQAEKRFDRMLWLRILNQGSFTLMVFVLAFLEQLTLKSLMYSYVASNLFASVMVLVLRWTMISTIYNAKKETVIELFHFGKYSMGTNISSNLFSVTNTFIINFLMGPAALAMYNLGGKLIQIVQVPLISVVTSGMPIISANYNKGEKAEMIYTLKKFIGMLTLGLIPLVILALIFANPIIHLLGGKNYVANEAPNLFRIFMIIALLYPADSFFAIGVDVIHQPKINFYKIIIMSIMNLLAVFLGVWIYKSIYSIAIASVVPVIVAILITYKPLNKFYKFNFFDIYKVGFKELMLLYHTQKKKIFKIG
ncbi:lipopolysaccharide biosynthesis protein [Pedobacter sp. Leaf170]|uniref:lipopolysaccharide biosynthesis protein n=1 Tax=Pedobacter sp. Leaf170 TaxID=2876558 RepID=UPI001E48BA14|nr:oligosaccharide flippase family protein [Pedobacter sp. Leaf170]